MISNIWIVHISQPSLSNVFHSLKEKRLVLCVDIFNSLECKSKNNISIKNQISKQKLYFPGHTFNPRAMLRAMFKRSRFPKRSPVRLSTPACFKRNWTSCKPEQTFHYNQWISLSATSRGRTALKHLDSGIEPLRKGSISIKSAQYLDPTGSQ